MNSRLSKYSFDLLETPSETESSKNKATTTTTLSSTSPDFPSATLGKTPLATARGLVLETDSSIHRPSSASVSTRTPARLTSGSRPGSGNTPYTSSSSLSNGHSSSALVAVVEGRGQARGEIGMASIDLKQPVLLLSQFSDSQTYTKTLAKIHLISPLEIILPHTLCEQGNVSKLFLLIAKHFPLVQVSSVQRRYFNESKGLKYIRSLSAAEYKSIELQVSSKYYCLSTAAALIKYVEFIQNIFFAPKSLKVVFKGCEHTTMIDTSTVKNLELLQNLKDASSHNTLFSILNFTKTVEGCRLLRSNILQPPNDEETIRLRQDSVMELTEKGDVFYGLQFIVSKFVDIGHIISVCVQISRQETASRAEIKLTTVILLKHVLQLVEPLRDSLSYCENQLLKMYCQALEDPRFTLMLNKINEVIDEGVQYHKGHLQQRSQKCIAVKSQINGLLDVARRTHSELVGDMENYIRQLAEHHKLPLRTAYSSLRGFYIQMFTGGEEGSKARDQLPPVFFKVSKFKNTLSFTTMDLIQLNERMKTALDEIFRMTNIVVTELLTEIQEHIGCLYQLTDIVGMTDMLLAFAHAATLSSYVCPEFTDTLAIKQGLHPILQKLNLDSVVPNDTYASEHSNFACITGPNMGGKSTYLRQIALLQIMAQMGSFVPAQYASFRIANQIFSRIGSDDDIESNTSTFTLEMKEINYILQNVSDNSLIIVDELGRGTSEDEGVGICWAVSEKLLKEKAYTFFVTHFRQLTGLTKLYPNVTNYYFEVQRTFNAGANCEKICYSHVLSKGVISETLYGLQLAELSTMLSEVLAEARLIAAQIKTIDQQSAQHRDLELVKQQAVFKLATRLIQAARNSKLDRKSLQVYLASLLKTFKTEMLG